MLDKMKKILENWDLKKHILLSAVVAIFFYLILNNLNGSSVGLIGGEDGPTAVFLATNTSKSIISILMSFSFVLAMYKPFKNILKNK